MGPGQHEGLCEVEIQGWSGSPEGWFPGSEGQVQGAPEEDEFSEVVEVWPEDSGHLRTVAIQEAVAVMTEVRSQGGAAVWESWGCRVGPPALSPWWKHLQDTLATLRERWWGLSERGHARDKGQREIRSSWRLLVQTQATEMGPFRHLPLQGSAQGLGLWVQ